MSRSKLYLLLCFLLVSSTAFSQYTLNGTAIKDNCHCYTLTTPYTYQAASVWNNTSIDLTKSFSFTFDVFLGCNDAGGADGLVFTLQTDLNSIGAWGIGQGFVGIAPSVGVSLDTYQNLANADPAYDHLSIQLNGDLDHGNADNDIAGPVPISGVSDNVEDCNWHTLKIDWDAAIKKYTVSFDGALRLSVIKDFTTDVFSGNPIVYWGFTGATGAYKNLQKFCLPLAAYFKLPGGQRKCAGDPIQFIDSSRSITPVTRYWDFGDGSAIDSVNVNPIHFYPVAGNYQVVLSIKGLDDCIEQFAQTISIIKPVADFTIANSCQQNTLLIDSSHANSGQINSWYWTLGDGTSSTLQNPTVSYTNSGSKTISLTVNTVEGCVSDTARKTIIADPDPSPMMTFNDACKDDVVTFTGTDNSGNAHMFWYWSFGDGITAAGTPLQHTYFRRGDYDVSLYTVTTNGCISPTVQRTIRIYSGNVTAGPDIIAAELQPIQLHGAGAANYLWSPSTGLNNPAIADPIATLTSNQTYFLKGIDSHNCISFDTVSIKVYKGPEVYVPNAFSPNSDGLNDIFKAIPVGIIEFKYFKIFNRWGKQVFTAADFNVGWDGRYNGAQQPPDVYVWILAAKDYKGNEIKKKGYVTLVR